MCRLARSGTQRILLASAGPVSAIEAKPKIGRVNHIEASRGNTWGDPSFYVVAPLKAPSAHDAVPERDKWAQWWDHWPPIYLLTNVFCHNPNLDWPYCCNSWSWDTEGNGISIINLYWYWHMMFSLVFRDPLEVQFDSSPSCSRLRRKENKKTVKQIK